MRKLSILQACILKLNFLMFMAAHLGTWVWPILGPLKIKKKITKIDVTLIFFQLCYEKDKKICFFKKTFLKLVALVNKINEPTSHWK